MSVPIDFRYLEKINEDDLKYQESLDTINLLDSTDRLHESVSLLEEVNDIAVIVCHSDGYSLTRKLYVGKVEVRDKLISGEK